MLSKLSVFTGWNIIYTVVSASGLQGYKLDWRLVVGRYEVFILIYQTKHFNCIYIENKLVFYLIYIFMPVEQTICMLMIYTFVLKLN